MTKHLDLSQRTIGERLFGRLNQVRDLVWPPGFLSSKEAGRYIEEGSRVVRREPFAPRIRDVSEVLLNEGIGFGTVMPWAIARGRGNQAGQQESGVQDWVRRGERIEINKHHEVTVEENMIELEIPMSGPWVRLLHFGGYLGDERAEIVSHIRTGPT